MKMIYRKFPKTASPPVTCRSVSFAGVSCDRANEDSEGQLCFAIYRDFVRRVRQVVPA